MDGNGKISKRLTDEQLAVVNYEGGHAIVEAVPGSGKTTVLIARLRRLLRTGLEPAAVLAVMFNKSAQLGFEARLRAACPNAPALPEIRTFHSVGYRILQRLCAMGALPTWRLDTSGKTQERFARQSLRAAWKNANGQSAQPSADQFQEFLRFITLVKSQLGSATEVFNGVRYSLECKPFVHGFMNLLEAQHQRKVMFFDDLIYRPMLLLAAQPELWTQFADRYQEILVDETQDINAIQFFMVKGLAGTQARAIAVGDPRQSIYAFRGGRVSIITEEFAKVFSPCRKFPLSRTFRFGHHLAIAANHLIEHNEEGRDRIMVAAAGNPDTRIEQIELVPKKDSGVVELLRPYCEGGMLRKTAMLARNFSHLVPYEIELAEAGVPYHVYGRQGLLFLPEIAALVCAVSLVADRWIIDPEDRFHFIFSLLTTPTPYVAYELLEEVAEAMEPRLDGPERTGLHKILQHRANELRSSNARAAQNLDQRADALRLLTDGSLSRVPAASVISAYIRMTGMTDVIERSAATPDQAKEALATLDAFVRLAERAGSIRQFLDLLGPLAAHKEDKPPEGDHCMLTTLHRSKGLEWPLVMLVGLVRGVFPSEEPGQMEEERRLAFVGMTRAIDRLVLFHPKDVDLERSNREHDWVVERAGSASPFLYESEIGFSRAAASALAATTAQALPTRRARVARKYFTAMEDGHIELMQKADAKAREDAAINLRPLPPSFMAKVGDKIAHAAYGVCTVLEIFHPPIYQIRTADGRSLSMVVTAVNGWGLAG